MESGSRLLLHPTLTPRHGRNCSYRAKNRNCTYRASTVSASARLAGLIITGLIILLATAAFLPSSLQVFVGTVPNQLPIDVVSARGGRRKTNTPA